MCIVYPCITFRLLHLGRLGYQDRKGPLAYRANLETCISLDLTTYNEMVD